MSIRTSANRIRKGFTLVELAVVIVIIGVLAAFGVPKFLTSVERSKASEAFSYLSAVRDAEERYLAQQGVYATSLSQLDISVPGAEVLHRPERHHGRPGRHGQPHLVAAADPRRDVLVVRGLHGLVQPERVRHVHGQQLDPGLDQPDGHHGHVEQHLISRSDVT